MQAVGRALASVSDPLVRARVLRWAAERFADSSAAPGAPGDPPASGDADLALDGVHALFDQGEDAGAPPEPAPRPIDHRRASLDASPLEAVVRSFVDDFRRLAREWQGATIGGLDRVAVGALQPAGYPNFRLFTKALNA